MERRKLHEERKRLKEERKKHREEQAALRRQREKNREDLRTLRHELQQLETERHCLSRTQVAHYRIEGLIRRGSIGCIYRARDVRNGREVAIKVALRAGWTKQERFRIQCQREFNLVANIDHPNVLKIEIGEVEGQPYIVMPFMRGGDLRGLLTREGSLTHERTLRILGPVAEALDAIHARGLAHGDVAAGNVLLGDDETPYLIDLSGRQDRRSDTYNFALLLSACLGGSPLVAQVKAKQREYPGDRTHPASLRDLRHELPVGLDQVIYHALGAKDNRSPPTCTSLMDAVRAETATNRFGYAQRAGHAESSE